ncbi:MAG: hypothetical protein JW840_10475 [Candidatus Thermoplasmatota archaeon]|nr:hypothetical protein [Candidatus Thermoplasmatota archaeon]
MILRKSRLDIHVEKTENFVQYLLKKRKESIQNCLIRPLYQEALKSLFLVVVLLLDALLPLEMYRILPFPANIFGALFLLGIFVYGEIRLYNSFWGKQGRWSIEKYKTQRDNATEDKKDAG